MIDRDWMTDVLSRTGFLRDADKVLRRLDLNTGYSLIYTNIRGFKTINDMFGEESGDSVIFMVRDKIKEVLEPLVMGRLDSDHFVAVVKNDFLKNNRMRKLNQMTFRTEYKMFDFTVTCGLPYYGRRSLRGTYDRQGQACGRCHLRAGCDIVFRVYG